jgi:hypothetical protein
LPDPAARLGAALAGRYRIERQLGQGGMATVLSLGTPHYMSPEQAGGDHHARGVVHEPRYQAMLQRMGLPENLRR